MAKEMLEKYIESLSQTPGPVSDKDTPKVRIEYKGLLAFAKEHGKTPAELSFEETLPFMTELNPGELDKVAEIVADSKAAPVKLGVSQGAYLDDEMFDELDEEIWVMYEDYER